MPTIGNYLHRKLKLPYRLHVAYDQGSGQPVIFLHGLASDYTTWRSILPLMNNLTDRSIALDLLGFGDSPKPDWPNYSLKDHANSVAYTIKKLALKEPPIIVGHSMGSLIATELATTYPQLVKGLVLCSMPIYLHGDFDKSIAAYKKTGRHLNNAYFTVYEKLIDNKKLALKGVKQLAILDRGVVFLLNEKTWLSFTKSLQNAVITQDSLAQLKKLNIPIHIVYGNADLMLMSKYYAALASINKHIKVTSVTASHGISPRYAKVVAKIIGSTIWSVPKGH